MTASIYDYSAIRLRMLEIQREDDVALGLRTYATGGIVRPGPLPLVGEPWPHPIPMSVLAKYALKADQPEAFVPLPNGHTISVPLKNPVVNGKPTDDVITIKINARAVDPMVHERIKRHVERVRCRLAERGSP